MSTSTLRFEKVYIDTKFKETDPDWKMPEKYLIGDKRFIDNALSYEAENDARIDMLGSQNNSNSNSNIILSSINEQPLPETNGIVAIPIKITVDRSDDNVIEIIKILEENSQRKVEQKIEILILLKKYVESGECMFEDKTGRFNFDNYTIKDVRAYKKKETPPKKGVWKFESYKNHHNIGTSFINSTSNIQVNECEILTCIDTYICIQDGVEIEKNLKSVWWMGYKY